MTRHLPSSVAFVISVLLCGPARSADRAQPKVQSDCSTPCVSVLSNAECRRVDGAGPGGSAFDVGPAGSWYAAFLGMPTVDFDGELYRLWFAGGELTTDPSVPYGMFERIGLATSRDGTNWEIANEGQPVLDLGPAGAADAKGCTHPFVLRTADGWMMWYGGIDGRSAKDFGRAPAHVRIEQVCLATSTDGIHWTRANGGRPVLEVGAAGSVDSIQATGAHVLRTSDGYMMWYSAYDGRHTLAAAASSDGIHWERANGGRALSGLEAGLQGQTGPAVVYDGTSYWMLYCADTGNEWKIYSAVSQDGFDWQPANAGKPVLGPAPTGSFGTAGYGRNHSAHPSQLVLAGDRQLVWFMAEDGSPPNLQRIGALEVQLP
jgi:predicted GH43/DUF377 family glycosyl hydrolase